MKDAVSPDSHHPSADPLLSIITVVYNGAAVLRRTLESVQQRKNRQTEYLVVDGGSSDGTLDLLRQFAQTIDQWSSEPDRGIYDAMNKGISRSRGKYLLFLNAGDQLLLHLDELQEPFSKDLALIYGKASMLNVDGSPSYLKGKRLQSAGKLLRGMRLCHQAIFYRRSLIGSYDLAYPVMADRVKTYQIMKQYGMARTQYLDRVIASYYEGGFSSSNLASWRDEELAFLRSAGHPIYALYRRFGWYWKMLRSRP